MSDVPPELITVIFTRLPVKSLLRFRCVSKSFRALIDSPNFIKSHLNQSSHQTIVTLNNNNQIHSTSFDSLDNPTLLPQLATLIIGSCNGLLCMLYGNDVFLYNPSTREKKKLISIQSSRTRSELDDVVYGLGYDCVNDDYKVVRITEFCDDTSRFMLERHNVNSEFMVYSLKANSWRRIKEFPYFFSFRGIQNAFVNGALHWAMALRSEVPDIFRMDIAGLDISDVMMDSKIVSFNLATEEFGLIPLPKFRHRNFVMKVVELGGRLSVHCSYWMNRIDVWVMSCYGVKESWSKLLTVSQPADISRFQFVQANAYSLDGERVLLEREGGKLYWYDLELKRVKRVRIPGLPNFCFSHMCVGSLVKLSGGAKKTDVAPDKTRKRSQKNLQRSDDFLSKGFKLVL